MTYDHVQLANSGRNVGRPDLGTVVIDLQAQSKVKGFELEVTALPVDGLTLGANVGHNQVKYVGTINPIVIASVGLPAGSTDFQPTLIPSWNGSLSAQYETRPLFDEARLNFRVDANWRSRQRTDSNPDVNLPIFQGAEFSPASWIVNARIALTGIKLGMADGTIALWARNLNDNKATQFPSFTRPLLFASSFQQARTFGVDLKLSM